MKTYDKLFKGLFIALTVFALSIIIGAAVLIGVSGAVRELSGDDRIALTVVGFIVLFILVLFTALGVLVYRDAKKLGMNAWMWTLIAIYAPNGIGFIIYLIFRFNEKKKKHCTSCGKVVSDNFSVCPACGESLGRTCPSCKKPVEIEWKVCPYCRYQLND
jgi:RNA polymerase subunit RPABC4/transcription elongation factor Spt4